MPESNPDPRSGDPTQLVLEMRLRPGASFVNFVTGENCETVARVRNFGDGKADLGAPWSLYVAGPASSGKSHLLEALCRQMAVDELSCAYLSLAERNSFDPGLLEGWENYDLVCVDGVEQLAGDARWERALFRLYNRVEQAGGKLALAGRNTPRGASIVLADLQSRLTSALVLPLRPLDERGRLQALKLRAQERGLEVNDEVGLFILRRIRQDMASLMGVLEQLDGAAMAAQRRLTIPFVRGLI